MYFHTRRVSIFFYLDRSVGSGITSIQSTDASETQERWGGWGVRLRAKCSRGWGVGGGDWRGCGLGGDGDDDDDDDGGDDGDGDDDGGDSGDGDDDDDDVDDDMMILMMMMMTMMMTVTTTLTMLTIMPVRPHLPHLKHQPPAFCTPLQVSRFVFEFNQAEKVSHLNQAYTWYGVNGVQYDPSSVSRRVPLGAVEEWVIVNKRLGKGEGAEGCESPRRVASDGSINPGTGGGDGGGGGGGGGGNSGDGGGDGGGDDDNDGGGGGNGGGRKTRALRERRGGSGRRRGLRKGMVGEEEEEEETCDRAGPGQTTRDGHPFHLHVNHFQVRAWSCSVQCTYPDLREVRFSPKVPLLT